MRVEQKNDRLGLRSGLFGDQASEISITYTPEPVSFCSECQRTYNKRGGFTHSHHASQDGRCRGECALVLDHMNKNGPLLRPTPGDVEPRRHSKKSKVEHRSPSLPSIRWPPLLEACVLHGKL